MALPVPAQLAANCGKTPERAAWLERFGAAPASIIYEDLIERTLDALAGHLAAHLDLDRLLKLAR